MRILLTSERQNGPPIGMNDENTGYRQNTSNQEQFDGYAATKGSVLKETIIESLKTGCLGAPPSEHEFMGRLSNNSWGLFHEVSLAEKMQSNKGPGAPKWDRQICSVSDFSIAGCTWTIEAWFVL